MLFKPEMCQAILDRRKTETRRLVKDCEVAIHRPPGYTELPIEMVFSGGTSGGIFGRLKWAVGNAYAIQPGRGKKAAGRFFLLSIRREWLQNITPSGILAEGIDNGKVYYEPGPGDYTVKSVGELRHEFVALWNSIHSKKGTRWADDPEVWVLEFEVVNAPD